MNSETVVVRIIHLDDFTTEYSLKEFLSTSLLLGAIKNVFINKDNELQIVFAYVIFEYSRDAKTIVNRLNGFCFQNKVLEIELIDPSLPYKRYKRTVDSNSVSAESLQTRSKTLIITPRRNLRDRQFDRFNVQNNDTASEAISNSVKVKNNMQPTGACTARVSGSRSSVSHLRQKTNTGNRMSNKVTNNEIQPPVSTKAAEEPRRIVSTQLRTPKLATLPSISSTTSYPDAFTRSQTPATTPLSSAVHQSNASAPRAYSSLASVKHQLNTATRPLTPAPSHSSPSSAVHYQTTSTRVQTQPAPSPLSSVKHLSNASTRIKKPETSYISTRPLTPAPSHSSASSAVHHQTTSTRAQIPLTSSPLSTAVHQSNASAPGTSNSSLSLQKHQINTSTRAQLPTTSHSSLSSSVHHQTTSTRAQTPISLPLSSAVHQSGISHPLLSSVKHRSNASNRAQTPTTSYPSLSSTRHKPNDFVRGHTQTSPLPSSMYQSQYAATSRPQIVFEHRPVSIESKRTPKESKCVIS